MSDNNIKNQIKKGIIIPSGNKKATVEVSENLIKLNFLQDIKGFEEIYAFFYDRTSNRCVAFADIELLGENSAAIKFNSTLIRAFSRINFKYVRICIALKYSSSCKCFFIKGDDAAVANNNKPELTIGIIESENILEDALLIYYSEAGLISLKVNGYEKTDIFKSVVDNTEISKINFSNDVVTIERTYKGNDWLYKNTNLVLEGHENRYVLKDISYKYDLDTNSTKVVSSIGLSEIKNFGTLRLKYSLFNLSKNVVINNEKVYSSSLLEREVYPISENKKIVVFKRINKKFEISICEKYYNSLFAVVMAVYNTEAFVSEAIESVLGQNVKNIKNVIEQNGRVYYKNIVDLILVDDGSTDNSGVICDQYADIYPNVHVIHKQNGGVSAARNTGIEFADSKYLNFIDSDDKFSENVFEKCFEFFEQNYNKINMVTFPIKFFDAAQGEHWLNNKFSKENRILNLETETDKSAVFVNAAIFKAEIIKQKNIRFDPNLVNGEDIKFIYSMFFNSAPLIGLVVEPTYWYRRRSSGDESAIQASKKVPSFYKERLENLFGSLIEDSIEKFGTVPKYVQNVIMQQLQWLFVQDTKAEVAKSIITEEEYEEFKQRVFKLIQYIDIDVILQQKKIYREHKYYIASKKQNCVKKEYIYNDIIYSYDGGEISAASKHYVRTEFLKIENGILSIEGFSMSIEKDSELFVKVNEEYMPVKKIISHDKNVYSLGEIIFYATNFIFTMELDDSTEIYNLEFYEKANGIYIRKKDIRFHKSFPLCQNYNASYFSKDGWYVKLINGNFTVRNSLFSLKSLLECEKYEKMFIKQLESSNEASSPVFKKAIELRKKVMSVYSNYYMNRRKKIWLVSDRVNMAGDNGEAMFRYLTSVNDPDVELYFVIEKDCPDYDRMQQYGKVIDRYSEDFRILYLLSDVNISSHADEFIIDPFFDEKTTDVFRNLVYRPKYVFLQHGVIKDDLSDWLNRFNKDISGFITAAYDEYRSILEYNYFYTEKEVWLTGLPRHDRLYRNEKRYITIMPTWRKYLSEFSKKNANVRVVVENFKESKFFKFYNALINNKKLIEASKKYNYQICFMPHPNIMTVMEQFDKNSDVLFFGLDKPYRDIYAESNLIMTDYSSSVMDFVYLRKPVVYCHFDKEEFFSGDHVYVQGYFDYERDGFGEVTYDIDSLIDVMIEYMQNDCKVKNMYLERMEKFFAYNDANNCERVYKKIKEMCKE